MRIAAIYVLAGLIWIVSSDRLLRLASPDLDTWTWLQSMKGAAFVLGSGLLIYALVRKALRVVGESRAESHRRMGAFKAMVENLSDALTVLEPDGRVRYVSPAFERITGYASHERVGKNALGRVHPDDLGSARTAFNELVATPGARVTIRPRIQHKDGSWRSVRLRGHNLTEHAAVGGIVVTYSDVTRQVNAERDLRESEERFRLMVEGSEQVFFYEHDEDGRFTYLSPSVAQVLGYDPEDLLGRPYSMLLTDHPSAAEVHANSAQALASRQRAEPYTALTRHEDGRVVALELIERPMAGDGELGMQGFARDITDRRQMEEQFRQAQKMEAVGRLAGGVAHDFNNILTAITGHVELVLQDLPESSPPTGDVREIGKSASRAAALTRQLLAFSRQQVLRPRVIDLRLVVEDMRNMLDRLIGEGIQLDTKSEPAPRIKADPGQLQQVIMNLVVNARDAMPTGGRIRLETRPATISPAEASQFSFNVAPGSYTLLTVSDDGEGMDEDTLEHAFDPFYTTKGPGQGTGLGLSTVYGIVKQSGGYIWVDSERGSGATFRIYLPATNEEEDTRDAAAGAAAIDRALDADAASGRVLIVEDEEPLRLLIQRILSREGYSTVLAASGEEALEWIRTDGGSVDLVLTDIVMPNMGGAELGRRVRSFYPDVKLVFMSGYTEDEMMRGGSVHPEVPFLAKPFSPRELIGTLRQATASETLETH